jgi:hypothetical protein
VCISCNCHRIVLTQSILAEPERRNGYHYLTA